jgi:hypothetical protein
MLVGGVMLTLLVGSSAAAPASTFVEFPAGIACSFPLRIDITGAPQVTKTFTAADGSVRVLSAGKGSDLVFTNLATGAMYALKGNGTVEWRRVDTSGSARLTFTGHNVIIYFPTDVPAGPSTTLVVGKEVIALDSSGTFTRLARSGTTTDICAALS